MYTQVTLTTTTLWDDVLWHVTATWRDDLEAPPVVITRSGRASLYGDWRPRQILQAAISSIEPPFGEIQAHLQPPED